MDQQPSQSNRDDLIVGLNDLVKSLKQSPRRDHRLSWLNSPIMVTFIASMAVAGMTFVIQERVDTAARERNQIRVVRSAKMAAFTTFADDFPITHTRLYDLRRVYCWLVANKITNGNSTENLSMHKTGKTYTEMQQHWYVLKAEFVKSRSFHSLIGQVEAAFDDSTILSTATELEASMVSMFDATNELTVSRLNQNANKKYTELVGLLATDIRTGTTGEAK